MPNDFRVFMILPLFALAACEDIALAGDQEALADLRGQRSCLAAVRKETGVDGVAINTTLPVVELNRFIVDVPNAGMWTCVTDENGRAREIVERRTG